MKIEFLLSSVGLCLCLSMCLSSHSLPNPETGDKASESKTSKADLKNLCRELNELRHSLSELKRDAKSLLAEFQRSDAHIVEFGDFINEYIDDKPTPYQEQLYPYGFQNIGNTGTATVPLPPRKEWVMHYSVSIKSLTELTEHELDDVITELGNNLPSEAVSECRELMARLAASTAAVSVLNERSNAAQSQKIIVEILGGIAQLELYTKKLVRIRVSM